MKPDHVFLIVVSGLRADAISAEPDRGILRACGLADIPNTPVIDRFAREGARFDVCRATSSCGPAAVASILTGQYPYRHGARVWLNHKLKRSSPTLFERLASRGFASLARIDLPGIGKEMDLWRGAEIVSGYSELSAEADDANVARLAEEHARAGRSVFCYFQIDDVTYPYGIRKEWLALRENLDEVNTYADIAASHGLVLRAEERAKLKTSGYLLRYLVDELNRSWQRSESMVEKVLPLYLQGVNRSDSVRLGRFFDRLKPTGILENSVVVITSDRADGIYESSFVSGGPRVPRSPPYFGQKEEMPENTLRVPLIWWSGTPWLRPGACQVPASTVDIAPTVLGLMGAGCESGEMDGIDRSPLLLGERSGSRVAKKAEEPSDGYAEAWRHGKKFWDRFSYTSYHFNRGSERERSKACYPLGAALSQQSVCDARYRLIRERSTKSLRLYDLKNDPLERVNLMSYSRALEGGSPLRGRTAGLRNLPVLAPVVESLLERLKARVGN